MTIADVQETVRRIRTMRGRVRVGLPAGPTEKNGTSLALVGRVHEFGAPSRGIPQRSFLRAGIEKNRAVIQQTALRSLTAVARGSMDIGAALGRVGLTASSAVQREIRDGSFVPLKAATIRRKRSSKPLIDSGSLRQGVTFTVETD